MTNKRVKSGFIIILVLIMGIAAAVLLYFYQMFYRSECFLPGVKVATVTVQGYSREQAEEAVLYQLNKVYATPVTFYNSDYTYETTLEEICLPLDPGTIINEVWENEQNRNLTEKIMNLDGSREIVYPIKLKYSPDMKEKLTTEWSNNLNREFSNARLEIDRAQGLVILPGTVGKKVDAKATFAALPAELDKCEHLRVPIVVIDQYPVADEEDLKVMGELSTYATWYNVNEIDRSHNLYLAASSINGYVLAPGQTFAFNKIVGPRTVGTGFRDAMVIVGEKFEPGLGGGICQVSSTLYNACLLAGLEIVERHNHGLAIAYVPLGLDATVAYGLQDFKFRNNTDYPIYIHSSAGRGKLTINIYGHLDYKKSIKLSHVVDRVIDFQEITEMRPELQPGETKVEHGGVPGYVVRSFRSYYDDKGQLIKQEQLATDRYRPLNKLVYTGPTDIDDAEQPDDNNDLPETDEQKEDPQNQPVVETDQQVNGEDTQVSL
ncbi:MAG: VanW family protein [Syntrophomonadaceae bacterium]|nr:VanW family protein [Syntrophomonadaceae bacterium]MDD3889677.1 VanW family protein [Syntrophomonadaceae bacterium]